MLALLILFLQLRGKEICPDQEIPGLSLLTNIPIDKGFSEYISGYTSGIIPANSAIEISFTPEFAAKADKSASGLFVFRSFNKRKNRVER